MTFNSGRPAAAPIDIVLDRFPSKPRRSGAGWMARCPTHDDRTPSLSISEAADGKVLLHCWAGCTAESVLVASGLRWRDLFPRSDDQGRWGNAR